MYTPLKKSKNQKIGLGQVLPTQMSRYVKTILVIAILFVTGTWLAGGVRASAGNGVAALKQLVRTLIPKNADQFVDKLRAFGPVPVTPGSFQGTTPSYYVIDNGNFRIGTGTENSINTSGNLVQPWYKGVDGGYYKLTYSNYPLDIAFGGGSGANWTGSAVTENPTLIG